MTLDQVPWFKGNEVAACLGYARPRKAVYDNVDEEEPENAEDKGEPNGNEEDDEQIKKKKKKKKTSSKNKEAEKSSSSNSSDDNSELEDDDLDLIKDNLNVDDLEEVGIKRKRRIQVASESSDEQDEAVKEPKTKERKKSKPVSSKEKRRSDEKEAEQNEENEEEEGGHHEERAERAQGDESDEEGSFIVSDSEAEDGEPKDKDAARSKSLKKKRQYTDEAQQEAMDIFGVNADELGAIDEDDEEEEEEEEYEEDDENEQDLIDDDDEEGLGDDDEELTYQKAKKKQQRQRRLNALHKIEDIFEPQELEKNLLTEIDQQIRLEDKPERFQLRSIPVTSEPDEIELEKEAEWIYSQAFTIKLSISSQEHAQQPKPPTVIPRIRDALNFIRNESYEVPFIASYRKEYTQPDLSLEDLWRVYDLDQKYCQLKQRKESLVRLFQRMQKYQFEQFRMLSEAGDEMSDEDEAAKRKLLEMIRPLDEKDIDRVRNAQTVEEFLDCYSHFNLFYAADLIPMKEYEFRLSHKKKRTTVNESGEEVEEECDDEDEPKFAKFALKKDRYHHFKMAGLSSFAKKFGLTPEQFGENLMADYQKHEIDQWSIEPGMVALDYVREPYFQSVDQVLTAVKYMVLTELAKDPTVRSHVRDLYMQRVCVSVRPTMPRGFKEIDENHACYGLKYLKSKPCSDLKQDEYLKIAMAEQDGLLVVKFGEADYNDLLARGGGASSASRKKDATPEKSKANDDDWDEGPRKQTQNDDDWDTPAPPQKQKQTANDDDWDAPVPPQKQKQTVNDDDWDAPAPQKQTANDDDWDEERATRPKEPSQINSSNC